VVCSEVWVLGTNILILVSVVKYALANCSPSGLESAIGNKRRWCWKLTAKSRLDDLEAADIGKEVAHGLVGIRPVQGAL
jgi:hypothetical protein